MKQDFAQFNEKLADLPASLPAGERVIWQGKPSTGALALRAFHIREVTIYFGALLVWRLWSNASAGMPAGDAMVSAAWLVVPALCSVAVLYALAWAFARAAKYTITTKRVLLQFGVALPMTLNVPLDKITGAALKTYRDGTGDIPLALSEDRGSFALLWPHVRPWRLRGAQPMLRSVPDAAMVAAKLNEALTGKPAASAMSINAAADTASSGAMPAAAAA